MEEMHLGLGCEHALLRTGDLYPVHWIYLSLERIISGLWTCIAISNNAPNAMNIIWRGEFRQLYRERKIVLYEYNASGYVRLILTSGEVVWVDRRWFDELAEPGQRESMYEVQKCDASVTRTVAGCVVCALNRRSQHY